MDTAFIYYKPVTGKNNIGRRSEQTTISNLLDQGENVVIYEPEKTGKKSLMQQTFYNMRISGKQFITACGISIAGSVHRFWRTEPAMLSVEETEVLQMPYSLNNVLALLLQPGTLGVIAGRPGTGANMSQEVSC